ncbi:hypothetical protein L9F63_011286 [Diploptera punctata]|uniref:N-acetyltransferase domain-containing protein n=1 Tax=Diploptera punctata TaxID=6984 RepID=A0AAD8AHG0_DIPPU|nr:hypothetical protein L9F63_011286 [Diploptera punctata]
MGTREFTRDKMPWVNLIILTLYNLHKRSEGVSRRGYFHWKMHICNFIERHWNILFGNSVRKKKSWMGTVSGTLSHYSPTYFRSGSEELRETGWWKLAVMMTPQSIMEHHAQYSQEKKKKPAVMKVRDFVNVEPEPGPSSSQESLPYVSRFNPVVPTIDDSSLSAYDDTSSVELNNAESECSSGRVSVVDTSNYWASLKASNNMYSRAYVEPSETLSDCLFADEDEECSDVDVDVEGVDICCPPSQGFRDLGELLESQDKGKTPKVQNVKVEIKQEPIDEVTETTIEDVSDGETVIMPTGSLFDMTKCKLDFLMSGETNEDSDSKCLPMSEYEELQLLHQLRHVPSMSDVPGPVRRLYRKLCIRRLKRERGMPLFNLDDFGPGIRNSRIVPHVNPILCDVRILDRFQRVSTALHEEEPGYPFILRLMGQSEPSCFYSPYTQRLLKPFIRRDMETSPLWLKLLGEIQAKGNAAPTRYPIDYSYVRPQHISSVNSLAREFFYPGIDLTECLQYPDFSCVVLYRKLVIGFAFMVPDVGLNEAYISFLFTRPEWRRAGIATFMLYHLIQTCMGKDLTLHVSAANPALILYQKFGFKVEEFVQDFYDKYLPADSKECKHALFLRLSR